MNPNTGNIIVDGVVQLAVAHFSNPNTRMDNEKVPDFLKTLSQTLIQCVQDVDVVTGSNTTPTVTKVQETTTQTTTAPVAETAKAPAVAPVTTQPVAAPAPAKAPKAAKAAKTVAAPVAAAPTAVADTTAPKPRGRPRKIKPVDAAPATEAAPVSITAPVDASVVSEPTATVSEAPVEMVKKPRKKRTPPPYKFEHISRIPFVPISESIKPDVIVCLIDGEERVMMSRHLRSKYAMSELEYKAHFNLPADYPMTSPSYAKEKSHVAKAQGLGTAKVYDRSKAPEAPAEAVSETPATATKVTRRSRKKAEATA